MSMGCQQIFPLIKCILSENLLPLPAEPLIIRNCIHTTYNIYIHILLHLHTYNFAEIGIFVDWVWDCTWQRQPQMETATQLCNLQFYGCDADACEIPPLNCDSLGSGQRIGLGQSGSWTPGQAVSGQWSVNGPDRAG